MLLEIDSVELGARYEVQRKITLYYALPFSVKLCARISSKSGADFL